MVTDWRMPNMDCLEFVNKAKALFENKCFFLLTGLEKNEMVVDYIKKKELHFYFQKPFKKELLESHFKPCTENLKIA
ncbi:MAG: response regulator RpfG family c-di-GMP phosphodiesterase [Sphingobacteriales bacterium]|jgi:response regulator RpfG family c-di-GMP phosphodiesterase